MLRHDSLHSIIIYTSSPAPLPSGGFAVSRDGESSFQEEAVDKASTEEENGPDAEEA